MENTVSAIGYDKKTLKKDVNKLSRVLIYLELLTILIFIVWLLSYFIQEYTPNNIIAPEIVVNAMKSQEWFLTMWYYILGTLIICIYRKEALLKDLRLKNKEMKREVFGFMVLLFLGSQFTFVLFSRLAEAGFNVWGYSIKTYIDSIKISNPSLSRIIYVAIIGPVFEELLFRGAILRTLEKYGKVFAIVVSSMLFGLMHMHIFQSIFAAVVGLILGYVAIEYSIKWAILLHVLNNFIVILYNLLFSMIKSPFKSILHPALFSMFFIFAAIKLYKHRLAIGQYIKEKGSETGIYKHTFKSFFLIIYILINIVIPFLLLRGNMTAL